MTYNEKAYICFAIFSCLCWNTGVNEIAYIEPKLKAFVGTPTEARVVLGFANRLTAKVDEHNVDKAGEIALKKIKAYEYLISKFPKTEEANYAVYVLGLIYADMAEEALAMQNYSTVIDFMQKIHKLYSFQLDKIPDGQYNNDMKLMILRINSYLEKKKI